MSFEAIRTGVVVRYPYLWAREDASGETEGRKRRPTAVAVRLERPAGDAVLLLAITTKEPESQRVAMEIPETEKRRAGLDVTRRQWVVLDEYNIDVLGRSYYLEPEPPIGRFSRAFFAPLVRRFLALRTTAQSVNRT